MEGNTKKKANEKRESLTARLQAKDATIGKRRLAALGKELLWGGMAYLLGLGSMLFDTKPLGVALLCAGGGHLVGRLCGLVLAELMLMQQPILMIATYAVATLIRAVASLLLDSPNAQVTLPQHLQDKLPLSADASGETAEHSRLRRIFQRIKPELRSMFSESIRLRMATAAVSMLVVSLYRIISGGFRYYDLFAAIFSILVAPAAVMVFSIYLEEKSQNKIARTLSGGALMYALVWSASNAAIANIPVSAILAMFCSLYVAGHNGLAAGAATGLLCGIAYDPLQAPAFLFAALVRSGVRWKKPESSGIPLALLAAWIWCGYVRPALSLTVSLPACLIAGASYSILLRIQAGTAETTAASDEPFPDAEAALRCERSRHEDSNDRFRDISDAFSSLSEMFYNLSDRLRRPGTLDLRQICDHSFDCFCTDCPNKTICWGLEYTDTLNVTNRLISHLHTKGKVSQEQIPASMRKRCQAMDRILDQINNECAHLTGELLHNNRTEILAMDYEAAANIINDALEEDAGEYRFDSELESRLTEYLSDAGIRVQSVSVYGMRRRQILVRGVNLDAATVTMETLRCDIGEMCGLELSAPTFEVENNLTSMLLQAKKRLKVTAAQNNLSADGGVSGDTMNLFSNRKDYFYALISDGMGAGRNAAFTSNLCSGFLEKMLRAGNRASTSLRMLNNLILSRCRNSAEECSSTVDLLELDLITGAASFMKSGAAPSFVLRSGKVHRLQAGTAPIGIIRSVETQTTRFDLRQGDLVVMISDGILQEDADCHRITGFLSQCNSTDPEEVAYRLCLYAAEQKDHDDCSVLALLIENEES